MGRKGIAVVLIAFLTVPLLVTGCAPEPGGQETGGGQQLVAKLGHVGAPDHIFEIGAQRFAELVLEKTNGEIIIETYPGGQLGGDRDMFESQQMGTIEFAIQGPLDSFLPITSVISLPYLFTDSEHVYKFLDSPLAEQIYGGLEEMGIIPLAYMENGWRLITSNSPINSMADMRGMKIRTPESPIWRESFTAFGASPVPLPFPELYGALQQGVVDGQENPVAHIMTQRFYEVQDYLALSRHMYLNAPLLVSASFWEKLTPEQQASVREAAQEATQYQRQVAQEREAEGIEFLAEQGMTITEPDPEEFRTAVTSVHEKWAAEFGTELFEEIRSLGE